jgi:hypothetical protein
MDSRAAIKASIDMGKLISMAYLEDLTDEEMMYRPHPECNHIKWQVGHLIASEHSIIEGCLPGSMPALPEGFAEKYSKETAAQNDGQFFHSKAELMEVFEQQRAGTLAALEKLSDADLSNPGPEAMRAYLPDWGTAFVMQDSHWVMHAGQWAVVRRQLGRPPLF